MDLNYIYLREMIPGDLDALYDWENRKDWQQLSDTNAVYTKEELKDFIHRGTKLNRDGQMRWMICNKQGKTPIGTIDLFDFNPEQNSAKIGILVAEANARRKGIASKAIKLLEGKLKTDKILEELIAETQITNIAGNSLFKKAGFTANSDPDESGINIYRKKINK